MLRCLGSSFSLSQSPERLNAKTTSIIAIPGAVVTHQAVAPAQLLFNTGFPRPGRPSLGSWALYGLGAETENLPAFVVMSTGSGLSGGSALWSSGFMPTIYTGVRFRNGRDAILNVATAWSRLLLTSSTTP